MRAQTSVARRAAAVAQLFAARRALMLSRRRLPRRRSPPRLRQPDTIRLAYFRLLLGVLERAHTLVERRLPRIRAILSAHAEELALHDAAADDEDIPSIFDNVARDMFEAFTNERIAEDVKRVAERTSEFHKAQWAGQMKASLGIDILTAEPWLVPRTAAFTTENVALIRSIPSDYFTDLEKRITRAMREGTRWESLADEISDRFDIAERRANFIARDQVGKWMGELNSVRQQEIGVARFIWRTAGDNRVRESHAAFEGEEYAWNDLPLGQDGDPIKPGDEYECRCQAEPVLDPLIEEATGIGAEEAVTEE